MKKGKMFNDDLDELDLISKHDGPAEGLAKCIQSRKHSFPSESKEEDYDGVKPKKKSS
jgi:hypothetical protein